MRDFRDAKTMAQTIRAALAAKGLKITIAESLELIAKAFGAADWNTLSAAIKAAEAEKAEAPPPRGPPPASVERVDSSSLPQSEPGAPLPPQMSAPGGVRFSAGLDASLHRAVALAAERRHGYTTIEHLLLALIDDGDAAAVVTACNADLGALKAKLVRHVDEELRQLTEMGDPAQEPPPTAGMHRVIQRSVIHVQSAGRSEVTGANILVAIFSERESHACAFLQIVGLDRYDCVNFIAHGIRKGGAAA